MICPQKVVKLNVILRHSYLPSRKPPAELVCVAQTDAAAWSFLVLAADNPKVNAASLYCNPCASFRSQSEPPPENRRSLRWGAHPGHLHPASPLEWFCQPWIILNKLILNQKPFLVLFFFCKKFVCWRGNPPEIEVEIMLLKSYRLKQRVLPALS